MWELLQQALEIYSVQARASRELVEGAWESVKKILGFYTNPSAIHRRTAIQ